jgi:hypothetical protein
MASRLKASPQRLILDLMKKNPPMSSHGLFQASPREIIPSRRRVKVILESLKKQNRIQVCNLDQYLYFSINSLGVFTSWCRPKGRQLGLQAQSYERQS